MQLEWSIPIRAGVSRTSVRRAGVLRARIFRAECLRAGDRRANIVLNNLMKIKSHLIILYFEVSVNDFINYGFLPYAIYNTSKYI